MSRSYKKVPYCGDKKNKTAKRLANIVIRRHCKDEDSLLQHMSYKKDYCSYDISDYGWLCTWKEYWRDQLRWYQWYIRHGYDKQPPNKKECYRRWYRYYKMK